MTIDQEFVDQLLDVAPVEKFRVWAEQTEGERPIWVPISDLFATLQHARAWCRHLNREFKIEPEEAEDD